MQTKTNNAQGSGRPTTIMMAWALLLVTAGMMSQWIDMPYPGGFLAVWGVFTMIGLGFQAMYQLGQPSGNFRVWASAISLGWLFTLYVVFVNISLYPESSPVWFTLLGLAYVHTARTVDRRFYALAALYFVMAVLFELSGRMNNTLDFLEVYGPVVFGVVMGMGLMFSALFARRALTASKKQAVANRYIIRTTN